MIILANTLMGLERELKSAADLLKSCSNALSVSSACELFTRFVTRTSLDVPVSIYWNSSITSVYRYA